VKNLNKPIDAYVLVQIAAQLLTIEYRRASNTAADPEDCEPPWHGETKSCVFDYSDVTEDTGKKLIAPQLCESCKSLLAKKNIRQSVISACMRIVDLAVRPKVHTLIRDLIGSPVMGFLFGGVFGMMLTDVLAPYISVWVLSVILIALVAVWVVIQYRRIPSIKI